MSSFLTDDTKAATFYFFFKESTNGNLRAIYFRVYPNIKSWRVAVGIADDNSNSYTNITSYQTKEIFSTDNQYHIISMSVTTDKDFIVHVDGTNVYQTNLSTYIGELMLERFSYQISPELNLLADDFYLTTDDTILK